MSNGDPERRPRHLRWPWRAAGGWVATAIIAPLAVYGVIAVVGRLTREKKPERTEVRLFVPGIETQLKITERDRGRCLTYSVVNPALEEAHRCIGGRFVYDPCLDILGAAVSFDLSGDSKGLQPGEILCVTSPWERQATALRWRGPSEFKVLPRKSPRRRPSFQQAHPWAMELTNGSRCVFVSGATYAVSNRRANYICNHSGTGYEATDEIRAWVLGNVDRSLPLWTVTFLGRGEAETREVRVLTAWY